MRIQGLEKASDMILAITVFLIPVVIWRIAVDPIDLVKGTFLWVFSSALLALAIVRLAVGSRLSFPKMPAWTFMVLGLAAIVASVSSMAPLVSVFGQYQRYTGLLTVLAGLLISVLVCDATARRRVNSITGALVVASLVVIGYGMIQEFGVDPLEWSASSFGKLVFSTLGNPNTASAWLSCVVPILFALWMSSRNFNFRAFLSVLLGFSGPMLGAFNSFQGQVAVLASVIVLVVGWRSDDQTIWAKVGATIACAGIIIVPQMPSRHLLFLVGLVWMAVALGLSLISSQEKVRVKPTLSKKKRVALLGSGFGFIVIGAIAFRGTLSSGLRGGFLERGDFYRAAWDAWKSNPVFGTGLETFGFVYGQFRPESHAVNLEYSRTSSVHNIYLGMFSNGGFILGIAYLVAMGVVAFYAFRLLRLTHFRSVVDAGIAGSWLAFQVISLVSVEHVALFTLNFTLAGLIMGRWMESTKKMAVDSVPHRKGLRRRTSARKVNSSILFPVAAISSVAVLLGCWQFSRPLRAANSAYQGLQSYYSSGDLNAAGDELRKASAVAPWEPLYLIQQAEILSEQGDIPNAAQVASRAAEKSFYQGGAATGLASIVFDSGDIARGIEILEKAVAADPFAPTLRRSLATIKVLGAQQYLNLGDTEVARRQLQEALEIQPDLEIDGLEALRSALGV